MKSGGFQTRPYIFASFALFAVRLFLPLCVRLRRNTFFAFRNRQTGASICHGFGARNLKREHANVLAVPGHSLDLLLRNA